jgi:hypothetical protein
MVAVPLPTQSTRGIYAEAGGRLLNAFLEKLDDGRPKVSKSPGIRRFVEDLTYSHCRGAIEINGVLLAALDDRLVTITESGGTFTVNDIGAFAGTETVYFARNNKSPTPDIVAVTDGTAFVVSTVTGASTYPDPDVGSPNSVCFLGGYFIFSYGNARMRASGLNDTTINTLDTAFAESKPDGLLRVVALGSNLYAAGPQTIEIWRNTGEAVGFPFSYLDTIPRGIPSADAIAGFENDWSNVIIFAGSDNVVYRINQAVAEPMSSVSVSKALEALADKTTLKAVVYSYQGHSIWALTSSDWTWCYDLSTGSWSERASYGRSNWRAAASVKCFGSWVIGDDETGQFGFLDPNYGYEFGSPLTATVICPTMSGFPSRASMSRLDLDILAGVGVASGADPIETTPKVMISWSFDGGVTFGSSVLREIGKQGQYHRGVRVNRLGTASAKGLQIQIVMSDPVPFSFFGGDIVVVKKG